ncbi:PulJ/GspJ family protein [Pseudolysinimonas kribbensis]|nr:prepilin-type N-terminal cleavage/methylation domain-containing protein [Pseudolysinimonas kribbensis]
MTDHTASDSGFTLVEMLVALALTTLVMTVIGGCSSASPRRSRRSTR